ncbi:rod shape-determining protein RodA [Robiginitomaculum antarcticum]|uniref:rod shape-determining protein RodA n=1 Tax=Robiginitomaculum antarcticum TaxID=437507 RepID=UPI0003640C9D|nr:rod shape-determining protein RodA [Robiginitomaculum antarcticum]
MITRRSEYGGLRGKLFEIDWLLPTLIFMTGLLGVAMIYASTKGVWDAGAQQHLTRLIMGLSLMILIAVIDFRFWFGMAYPAYLASLLLLIGVEVFGVSVNGSQRWLDIYVTRIQPSEIMKLAVVLALARFYHDLPDWRISKPTGVLGALIIIALPALLVLRQPDLGTTLLIIAPGLMIIFLAGVRWRIIGSGLIAAAIAVPLFYKFGLKDYQRERIWTFLDPSRDPSGASYHITQSKIALGSGGVNGKGFMKGTQANLDYVPENRTDFIFTVIGEQFGLLGGIGMMALYMGIAAICMIIAARMKNVFSKLMIAGITATFMLYVYINLAMVTGLAPVVGVPLPLISYGGTVMLVVLAGFGLILSAHVHRNSDLPRGAGLLL